MKAKVKAQDATFAAPSVTSRRRNLRLGPPERLSCALKDLSGPFAPRDISAGGVSVASEQPLKLGDIYEVTLTLDDLRVVRFAKVIHSRKEPQGHWITGLAFLNVERDGATVQDLLNRIAPEMRSS